MVNSIAQILKLSVALAVLAATRAEAHASEQGFVLLLPTGLYTLSGVATVALTVLAVTAMPGGVAERLFRPWRLFRMPGTDMSAITGSAVAALMWALVIAGFSGPHDPLANPLPLAVWTLFWIGLVTVQGLFGDIWRWLDPIAGPVRLARRVLRLPPPAPLPAGLGHAPGILAFLGFAWVLLADPAPADPDRLARLVAGYWLIQVAAGLVWGPRWLRRGEGIALAMRTYGRLGIVARHRGRLAIGLPGWQVTRRWPAGWALMPLILLGVGSFDGLNETFWWMGRLGINPFEFPGRSAMVLPSSLGLLAALATLLAAFTATLWLGLRLAGAVLPLGAALQQLAPTLLPIALGYHVAHYLTSALVDGQYLLVALSDPFLTGADWLGLGTHYVSTGFFNTRATVRVIFLTQAGAVVLGHVLAVVLAHHQALRLLPDRRSAVLTLVPLSAFMVGYTLFGLWLLASPRL